MTRTKFNQAGFEAVGVIVAVLFLAVVGFAGYKVMSLNKPTNDQPSSAAASKTAPSTIKNRSDLSATSKSLDQSGSQLDSNLNDGSLDSDVSTLL